MRSRFGLLSTVLLLGVVACQSNGLVVETVNDYGGNHDLQYSHADGDNFIAAMTPPAGNGEWRVLARWKDLDVYDTDFLDGDTWDQSNFDQPGTAISFFSGHGLIVPYGESPPHRCSHSAECTSPPAGIGRGVCKAAGTPGHAIGDTSQCVYDNQRQLVVNGRSHLFNNLANYSNGDAKWGESSNSGPWAGAGTNGGTNVVVLDASWGVLASFWYEQTNRAMAGVHFLATTLPVTGDYLNDPGRGAAFAKRSWQEHDSSVAHAWLVAMNSIPGGGFDASGCHFVIAYDQDSARALKHLDEDWSEIKNDGWDSKGKDVYWARWLCNFASTITDDSIFELR
jgi:hypothetical protein